MYHAYWNLERRPFEEDDQAMFYYPVETHQATLLKLHYVLENRRSGAALAGLPGLGKTRLVRILLDDLEASWEPRIHVRFPRMEPDQLVAYLVGELTGRRSVATGLDANLRRLEGFLKENRERGCHAVVVIDEAHTLSGSETLETIRLLMNYVGAWTWLLVGQPGLLTALERMPTLEERLSVKCVLQPFSGDETVAYLSHRLRAAGGGDVHRVFDPEALERLHALSEGIPRRINRLADLALLVGFAEERATIQAAHVEAVAQELLLVSPAWV